jgi:hypothetical protein
MPDVLFVAVLMSSVMYLIHYRPRLRASLYRVISGLRGKGTLWTPTGGSPRDGSHSRRSPDGIELFIGVTVTEASIPEIHPLSVTVMSPMQ